MVRFETGDTVYTPYFNQWNANVYERTSPFEENPWALPASSTSGAPVVVWPNGFVGCTYDGDMRFRWNGKALEVDAEQDRLFIHEGPVDAGVWDAYHRALNLPAPEAPFGRMPEYGTWVEQGWRQREQRLEVPRDALSLSLIDEQLEAIHRRGWPRGRYTIDDGWSPSEGPGGYGDWEPRPRFGDMSQLARRIRDCGHVPGLWLAPLLISPQSRRAQKEPGLVGEPVQMGGECAWNRFHFLSVSDDSRAYLRDLFARVCDWGYRKLKLDIFYGRKRDMMELSAFCREAVQALPAAVELECHVPDPFCARYVHVIRTNDVLITSDHPDWRGVAEAHYRVCRQSCPRHMLNLDHIGGNHVAVTEALFLEHAGMLERQLEGGHPMVSLMPGHLGEMAVDAVTRLLRLNEARRR